MKRLMIFGLIAGSLWTGEAVWLMTNQPKISASLAVNQLNGGEDAAARLREYESLKDASTEITGALTLIVAWLCFESLIRAGLGLATHAIRGLGRQTPILLLAGSAALLL